MATSKRKLEFEATEGRPEKKICKKEDPLGEAVLPSAIDEPSQKVSVCAMVASLSPMRNKRFTGELVDEDKAIRFVGFDKANQSKLEALANQNMPVKLTNCDIQFNTYSKSLEVVIKGYTKVETSPVKFNIKDPDSITATNITISQLPNMKEHSKVNVKVKVIEIKDVQVVGGGKSKQEVVVADSTENATLTLWEKDIDTLTLKKSYSLKKMYVRIFNNTHYMSLPPHGATVTEIDDIGDVKDVPCDNLEQTITDGSIIAVKDLQEFRTCLACKGKVLPQEKCATIGTCQNCNMVQKISKCGINRMAKFMIEHGATEIITLVAYGELLFTIADATNLSTEAFLNAPNFNLTYNDYHVITSVSRN